jgi:hypothetical protein
MRHAFRRGAVLVGLGLLAAIASVRCADVNRGLGDACIRNSDCLSGVCAGQQCVAAPTLFDASTATDAGVDASPADGAAEGSKGSDTGIPMKDAGHDAAADTGREAGDATGDALTDVNHDTGVPDGSTKDGAPPEASGDVHAGDAHVDGALKDGTPE